MRFIVTATVVLGLVGAGDAQDAAKKDLAALEGQWKLVSLESNGVKFPADTLADVLKIDRKGEIIHEIDGKPYLRIKTMIEPNKKPKSITWVETNGSGKETSYLGIYELDRDTLRLCLAWPGKERPSEFSAKEGSQRAVGVWKRVPR